MFETTSAIIIHCQKYSDKAVILHTYTRREGRQNFMVYGGNKKSSLKGLIETPLSIVEITYDNKPGRDMHSLHSIAPLFLPTHEDNLNRLVRMFMSEVIYKTLRQPMADERVYDFLERSIKEGTNPQPLAKEEVENDHLSAISNGIEDWMMQLSALLGYGGEWLDEWKELNSLDMIREVLG